MIIPSRKVESDPVMTFEIHPITRQSLHQAAQLLARAFVDDPVTLAVYNNFSAERLTKALEVDFSGDLVECVRRGCPVQVNDGSNILGAAVVYPPGSYPLPVWSQWILLLKSVWGNGFYNVSGWMQWLYEVDKLHPSEPHYYLEYIGVEPEYQRKGVGSTILHHLGEMADKAHVGCYLENANPINTAYYQHFGFQVTHHKEIIGIPTWFMWRPPG
jgi:ribosomal protein S18 acetylase RimI-like enzyme